MFAKFHLSIDSLRFAAWGRVGAASLPAKKDSGSLHDHRFFPILRISPSSGNRHVSLMREGMIPSYAHDENRAHERRETRAQSLTTSSALRCAFGRRRCIIPADAFIACQQMRASFQVPYSFALESGENLWDCWALGELAEQCRSRDSQLCHRHSSRVPFSGCNLRPYANRDL